MDGFEGAEGLWPALQGAADGLGSRGGCCQLWEGHGWFEGCRGALTGFGGGCGQFQGPSPVALPGVAYIRVSYAMPVGLVVQEVKHELDGEGQGAATMGGAQHRLKQIIHKLLQCPLYPETHPQASQPGADPPGTHLPPQPPLQPISNHSLPIMLGLRSMWGGGAWWVWGCCRRPGEQGWDLECKGGLRGLSPGLGAKGGARGWM